MPPSPTGPSDADAFLAVCSHTHLFPGARCRIQALPDPPAFAANPLPVELLLRFCDDVVTAAELQTEGPTGPLLAVPAYTTAAGTPIGSRTWSIRELAQRGDEVEVTIGGRAAA
ncbi:hypothetical protein ABZ721_10780 [Streptomyces sp. NPDC006733]|uniref:hypothetical protein n=1 Tax=Streptomyces sp. NPDC006733 TaxID=3155460 RepID=UPI0033E68E85